MSLYGVQRVLFLLKNDQAFAAGFKSDAYEALAPADLADAERRALMDGDLATLYGMGAHPLLLAPYSRFMGIARPDYQAALAPLKGTRRLRSARA